MDFRLTTGMLIDDIERRLALLKEFSILFPFSGSLAPNMRPDEPKDCSSGTCWDNGSKVESGANPALFGDRLLILGAPKSYIHQNAGH